jgi:hypothetical protein
MIHPILNLPEFGPLQSNFLELIVQPGFQPQWWENNNYDNRFGGPGGDIKDGRVATYGTHSLSMRFDVAYDNRGTWSKNMVAASGPGPYFGFASQFSYNPTSSGTFANLQGGFYKRCNSNGLPSAGSATACWGGGSLIGAPLNRVFWECFGGGHLLGVSTPAAPKLFDPLPASLRSPTGCAPGSGNFGAFGNNEALTHNNNHLGAAGDYALWDYGVYHIPGMQPQNWNEGVRFHTLVGATEITALYYNDNMNGGFPTLQFVEPYYTNLGKIFFPDIQEVGITADRPLPVPASLGEYLPIVGRAEVIYINHTPIMDNRPMAFSALRYTDVMKWMAALDIDQAYAPWLTSTGNLTAFFEVFDQITMDNSKITPVGPLLSARNSKNQVYSLASIGAGFFWEDVEPTWTMIYQPQGNTFALFPTLVLNPPWTKKYFMKLQAIEVMGGNRAQGLGLFKGQSLLTAQFQYNFNLL